MTLAAYPGGPYCAAAGANGHLAVGCVLPNTSWIGYDDEAADELATMKPYAAYSLGDTFANAQKTGKKYAMLNLADFSCPGCAESGAILSDVGDAGVSAGASVVQAGGVVIELLEAVNLADVPTKMQLDTWVNDPTLAVFGSVYPHAIHVTSVEDPNPGSGTTPAPSLAFFGRRDQAYIIDLTTMKILQYINGSIGPTPNGTGNSAYLAMAAMHQLLGK
jgi:hypothetical protein